MAGDGWREVTVEDLKALTENALATGPFGSSISSRHFQEYGVPVIRGSNLSEDVGTRLNDNGLVFVSEEKAAEFKRSIIRKGDLVFTCWGTINQVGLIDNRAKYSEYVISNKQMKFTPDSTKADSLFLYYLFSGPQMQDVIKNQAIGSSVPGFNLGQLRAMRLSVPRLDEQQAIAHILSTLDDKIELNRRMNETLEAMARAIFKSWFVDFDPVRAKAEGRDPGLPKHLAPLFPHRFHNSELGLIPEDWRVYRWGELATLEYGRSLSGYENGKAPYPVYGTNGRIGSHSTPLCSHPGIIIGRKGAYRGVHFCNSPFFVIDTAFYLEPKQPLELRWAYYELLRQDINTMDSGSAIPSTSREDFYSLPVLAPPFDIQQCFVKLLAPIWTRQEQSQKEALTLAAVRDALLPKLISGELRVKDAERVLAEARA
jgi:type I restriction enzyme S subunit